MEITCVGGGPGGLYAALLFKRADPSRRVTVFERNAAGDTFGWGVVFSAATMTELADADRASYDAIMRACARWDPVDIVAQGQLIRARGNQFAAISRKVLLDILHQRAADLGVDLRFSTEVDPERVDGDLVIAADGIHSATRQRFADAFGPRLTREGGKFIWFGTTKALDAFTFVFRDTEHGRFQVHSYPFDEQTSTFIVECDQRTWLAAGLDVGPLPAGASDERAIAFCEELFAPELAGHALLGNASVWRDWVTVRNRSWRHGNIVLLGDAAHTAHFSIGSGTKLAMEDAIALASAVDREDSVDAACAAYESDRRPVVERVQQAASESLAWFARNARYRRMPAPQFAYSLLTRSGRVDYNSLRRRDPDLATAYERWFAGACAPARAPAAAGGRPTAGAPPAACAPPAAGAPAFPIAAPPPALTPLRVGGLRLANRLVLAAPDGFDANGGLPGAEGLQRVEDLGRGGAGMVLVEHLAVAADARVTPASPGLYTSEHADAWGRAVERCHAAGARAAAQLLHAGRRGATEPRTRGCDRPLRQEAWPLVSASPIPYTSVSAVPLALVRAGMDSVRDAFAASARLAADAGFDLLEVHLGHGYLLASFLSPLSNRREDAYGGSIDGRLAFPLEVVAAVREAWPADRPLSVCLSASDLQPGGLSEADAVEAARRLTAAGADLCNVVAGQTTPAARPEYGRAFYAPWSDLVRNAASVATVASGNIPDVADANDVLAAGKADLCILGRPHRSTPDWLRRQESTWT